MNVSASVLLKKISQKPAAETDRALLSILAGALEEAATSAFSAATGLPVSALAERCEAAPAAEAADGMTGSALVALNLLADGETAGFLGLDAQLVTTLTDVLTCGDIAAEPGGHLASGTPLEADLCASAVSMLVEALRKVFSAQNPGLPSLNYAGLASPGTTPPISSDQSDWIAATLSVEIGTHARQGKLTFATATLPAEGAAGGRRGTAGVAGTPAWTAGMARNAENLQVPLTCVVGRTDLTLARIGAFRSGATIDLPDADLNRVSIETEGGLVLARGALGSLKGGKAFRFPGVAGTGGGEILSGTGDDQGDFAPGLE